MHSGDHTLVYHHIPYIYLIGWSDYNLKLLMDIKGTTQYLQLTTRDWVHRLFQEILNEQACMFRSS